MKKKCYLLLCVLAAAAVLCSCGTGAQQPQETTETVSVIVPKQEPERTPTVDYTLTDLPVFVENLSQCTDPEKKYVLPDGYLYGLGSDYVPTAENQLLKATDADGGIFNGCGYQDNARIRGILEIGETDYSFITGFIPLKAGDTVYFGGDCFLPEYQHAGAMTTVFYDGEKNVIGQTSMQEATQTFFETLQTSESGYITAMQVNEKNAPEGLSYVRFSLMGSGANQIVSVNESLEEKKEVPTWVALEEYISLAWMGEIEKTVETIRSLPLADPASAPRFVLATDIHVDPDGQNSYTWDLGKISAAVMGSCDISFFTTAGDNCTQSSGFMPSAFVENMQTVLKQLEPIPQENILLTVGNHDGATGAKEVNGETLYYRHQLNNEERSEVFFGWQRESNPDKQFDSDGTYFYLDDPATKTRYILLNSFWAQWEGEEDGFVPDVQHAFMQSPLFGPQQLTWFAQEALAMPEGYGAIIITHFAPAAKDFEVFKGIVDAYSDRTNYQGSYVGEQEWQNTQIAVDYDYASGEIIAVLQGHNHEDAIHDYFKRVPCINVTTTGAYWSARGETALERNYYTDTQFAVDVIVVDRESRTIYLTRLGAGEDRVVTY